MAGGCGRAASGAVAVVKRTAPQQGVVVQTERGRERQLKVNGTMFRIPARYNHLEVIGKGSYGMVCSAVDSYRKNPVAIKKISHMAAHSIDAKHVLREVRVMRYLGAHENIVTLEDLFCSEAKDELYIVMELLESDLHRIIQSQQKLSTLHHRVFMLQILRGVGFLHQNGIMHRDLKPGNILVNRNCELRISDFGLARARPKDLQTCYAGIPAEGTGMTEHVVTRWYRPPELMLSPNGLYNFSVDLWSVGCIFGELLGRRPLFPGSSFVHQLSLIFDVIGSPAPEEVEYIRGAQARKFLLDVQSRPRVNLTDVLPGTDSEAASLLEGLLRFDPEKRSTAAEALNHSYFETVRGGVAPYTYSPKGLDFEFERKGVSRSALKTLIAGEIDYFQSGANLRIHAKRNTHHAIDQPADPTIDGDGTIATNVAAAAAAFMKNAAFSSSCSSDNDGETVSGCSGGGISTSGDGKRGGGHVEHSKCISSPSRDGGNYNDKDGDLRRCSGSGDDRSCCNSGSDVPRDDIEARENVGGDGNRGGGQGSTAVTATAIDQFMDKASNCGHEMVGNPYTLPTDKGDRPARSLPDTGNVTIVDKGRLQDKERIGHNPEERIGSIGERTRSRTVDSSQRDSHGNMDASDHREFYNHSENHSSSNAEKPTHPPPQNKSSAVSARLLADQGTRDRGATVAIEEKSSQHFSDMMKPVCPSVKFSSFLERALVKPPTRRTSFDGVASGGIDECGDSDAGVRWVVHGSGRWSREALQPPTTTRQLRDAEKLAAPVVRNPPAPKGGRLHVDEEEKCGGGGCNRFFEREYLRAPKNGFRGSNEEFSGHASGSFMRQRAAWAWQKQNEASIATATQAAAVSGQLSVHHPIVKGSRADVNDSTVSAASPPGMVRTAKANKSSATTRKSPQQSCTQDPSSPSVSSATAVLNAGVGTSADAGDVDTTATHPMRAPIASVHFRHPHTADTMAGGHSDDCSNIGGASSAASVASSHGSPPAVPPPLRQRWRRSRRSAHHPRPMRKTTARSHDNDSERGRGGTKINDSVALQKTARAVVDEVNKLVSRPDAGTAADTPALALSRPFVEQSLTPQQAARKIGCRWLPLKAKGANTQRTRRRQPAGATAPSQATAPSSTRCSSRNTGRQALPTAVNKSFFIPARIYNVRKQANDNCESDASNSAVAGPSRPTRRPSSLAEAESLSNGAVTTAARDALRSGPRAPATVHRKQPALKREHRMSTAVSTTDRVRAGTETTPAGAMTTPAAPAPLIAAAHAAGTRKSTKNSIHARCKPQSASSVSVWAGSPVPDKYGFDDLSTTIPVPNGTLVSAILAVDGVAEAAVKRGALRHVATTKAWQALESSSRPQLWENHDPATGVAGSRSQVRELNSLSGGAATGPTVPFRTDTPADVGATETPTSGPQTNEGDDEGADVHRDDNALMIASVEEKFGKLQRMWMRSAASERIKAFGTAARTSSSRSVAPTWASPESRNCQQTCEATKRGTKTTKSKVRAPAAGCCSSNTIAISNKASHKELSLS